MFFRLGLAEASMILFPFKFCRRGISRGNGPRGKGPLVLDMDLEAGRPGSAPCCVDAAS